MNYVLMNNNWNEVGMTCSISIRFELQSFNMLHPYSPWGSALVWD